MKANIIVYCEKKYGKDTLALWNEEEGYEIGRYGGDYDPLSDFHKAVMNLESRGFNVEFKEANNA